MAAHARRSQADILQYARTVLSSQNLERVQRLHLWAIRDVLPANGYAIYVLDPRDGRTVAVAAHGVPDAFLGRYEELGRADDPFFREAIRERTPIHDRVIFPRSHWSEAGPYHEMLRGNGYTHHMVAPITYGGDVVGTINFVRGPKLPAFRSKDLELATTIMEFAGVAVGHALEHTALLRRHDATAWVVSKHPAPMIISNAQGEIVVASDAVQALTRQRQDVEGLIGALLDNSVAGAAELRARQGRVVDRRWGDLYVRSIRIPGDSGMVVTTLLTADAGRPSFTALRPTLTAREVEVLEHAALGMRDHEIATELTVTVHTVKQHLKNAYRKLGARSRTEATRKAQAASRTTGDSFMWPSRLEA